MSHFWVNKLYMQNCDSCYFTFAIISLCTFLYKLNSTLRNVHHQSRDSSHEFLDELVENKQVTEIPNLQVNGNLLIIG